MKYVKDYSKRGLASASLETRKRVASAGGRAASALGTAHKFNSKTATIAGRKGGLIISKNREYMREIGRLGGLKRRGKVNENISTKTTHALAE